MANVWIIDDSALDAQRARLALSDSCAVEVFSDGSSALERLSNGGRPDAMVLDQVMPGVSGIELIEFMRSERLRLPQVPVLLLTAQGASESIVAGLQAGANDYLPKPFSPQELRARVEALLRSGELLHRALTAEAALQSVLESVPDAVLALDSTGKVTFANPEAARVFQVGAAVLVGRELKHLVPALGLSRSAAGSHAPLPDLRIGDRLYSPSLGGGKREGEALTLVLHDVTERRRLDERRLDFYSIIAHDMRSPLTAMMLRLNRVLSGRMGRMDEPVAAEVQKLESSMKSMADIITDFLDIARLEGDPDRLERLPVQLSEVVAAVLDELRPIADVSGVALALAPVEGETTTMGDRGRLRQVVVNLVGNAVKFTPSGGKVTVRIESEPSLVRTRVVDTGPGIPESLVPGLFERFTRAPDQEATIGTGLGLMIVRQIVEAHGGQVGVETALGQGSTFWFTLPR